jgi:5'-nucleotidase
MSSRLEHKQPLVLSDLRILLTNDDGIDAEGLLLLERLVRQFTQHVWVCAPATNQSAKSHSLTTKEDIVLHQHDERRFAVTGTPADSVVIGVQQIMRKHPPHFVLAGINAGRNLADDVVYSGTVAAAREAAILGIPGIAFSQQMADYPKMEWLVAEAELGRLLPYLLALPMLPQTLLNVNFPACLSTDHMVELGRQGRYKVSEAVTRRGNQAGNTAFRIQTKVNMQAPEADTDIAAIARGNISITPLNVDTTAHALLKTLPPYQRA